MAQANVPLSESQSRCLTFLLSFHAEQGFGPSHREISDHLGLSVGHVRSILRSLKAKGRISQLARRNKGFLVNGEVRPITERPAPGRRFGRDLRLPRSDAPPLGDVLSLLGQMS